MNQSQITETLCKQLELLAERSKECADEELAEITLAMIEIYDAFHRNKALDDEKEILIEGKVTVDPEQFQRILKNAPEARKASQDSLA